MQILTFRLLNEEFGVNISCVREVLLPTEIYPIPNAPAFVDGVINLREHIITVIDLRKKLNMYSAQANLKARIVVCRLKRFIVGLVVDSVNEVISIPDDRIDFHARDVSFPAQEGCVLGIARQESRVIIILDLDNLISSEEAEKLNKKAV